MASSYLIVLNRVFTIFIRGQCKLRHKRLLMPFYKAKNYEIALLIEKRLLVKKRQGKLCPRLFQI